MIFYKEEEFIRYVNAGGNTIIGVTSGCFDLLHPLHVEYLNKCKTRLPDNAELFVFIDSDRLVHEHKKKVPLINELDRAYMVDSLKPVSGVIDKLICMSDCIRSISAVPNSYVMVFKHSEFIYNTKLFTYDSNVENIIVPDTIRFQSTTEITNHLKSMS